MLRRVRWYHHLAMGVTIAGIGALALFGVIGEPRPPERFDARQIVVAPADPSDPSSRGLRITEVIDQDFGHHERRGHERFLPLQPAPPTDVVARSDTAPDDVSTAIVDGEFRIRIGDPDQTVTGQHRYVLGFTLPEARLETGTLSVDMIGTEESLPTGRVEIYVVGFALADPVCAVGGEGAVGGCELVDDGGRYRAVITSLEPGEGVNVGGTITGRTDIDPIRVPPFPPMREPVDDMRLALALGLIGLGAATALAVLAALRRAGRNEVFAGGAADAAFGSLDAPGSPTQTAIAGTSGSAGTPVHAAASRPITTVTDRRLGDLATVEFAPPAGLQPWEGAVLIRERIDDHSVGAWFSGLAGSGAIDLSTDDDDHLVITPGPRRDRLDATTSALVDRLFQSAGDSEQAREERLVLDGYDERFGALWGEVRDLQDATIHESGWWKRLTPRNRHGLPGSYALWAGIIAALTLATILVLLGVAGLYTSPALALPLGPVVTGLVAFAAYHSLLPARSAAGSALTLRTESFRRFLEASEGQHVDWAWERGVVREYSAWAVALGAATAWGRALEASSVATNDPSLRAPLLVHSMAPALAAAHVKPSSSGSGGSGGFSAGRVGGGVGGGRSGSW